ncbi:MAG: MCE family protein [Muribaculaceae bacterium]|nr:MCE family protein [Muribaculaceae bacterium]
MKFFNKNVKIALTVLLGLAILYWGINYLKGINLLTPANHFYTEVESVDGLLEAAPITVNGFQVGQVREINYDYEKNKITILLSMERDMKVPEGSTINMVSGVIGGTSLVLNLGDGPAMKVGSLIPAAKLPGLMDNVTENVLPVVNDVLPKVDSIMANVNGLTADPALAASLTRLDAITRQLQAISQQLTMLMNGLNRSVPGVMNNVNGITNNLTGASGNLSDLSASLKDLPLDETLNKLNTTLANLQQLSEQLNDKNSSLGKIMNDRELYDNANHAIASLDSLLTDIKANPKRYINVKVF